MTTKLSSSSDAVEPPLTKKERLLIKLIKAMRKPLQLSTQIDLAEYVRTAAGEEWYHEPIGSLIVRHSHAELLAMRQEMQAKYPRDDPRVRKIRATVIASRKAGHHLVGEQATGGHYEPAIARWKRAQSTGERDISSPKHEGAIADTKIVEYKDGSKWVHKAALTPSDANHEELASKISDIIGAGAPQIVYRGPEGGGYSKFNEKVVMPLVDGKTASEIESEPYEASDNATTHADRVVAAYKRIRAAKDSPEAKRIGLLDVLIANSDRNNGNWLITQDGTPIPIDHSFAWHPSVNHYPTGFAHLVKPSDFSNAELDRIEAELKNLRSTGKLNQHQLEDLSTSIETLNEWRSGLWRILYAFK